MNRREWIAQVPLLALGSWLGRSASAAVTPGSWGADEHFGPAAAFDADITVQTASVLHPANARLCGTNVQWVDGGDGLLVPGGTAFVPAVLANVKRLAPTVIRYPGGTNADVFNWRASLGPLASRGTSEHYARRERETIRMGTAEFLALCEATGAEAIITANASTMSAADAAAWVRQVNVTGLVSPVTGRRLPRVPYWEIGNEPYLIEPERPETVIKPADYASRAKEFIAAMRVADPTIQIGIPLRSDTFNGVPVTPYPGFNEIVLKQVASGFDFVSVHNGYMPWAFDKMPPERTLYAALMASPETVRNDFNVTVAQMRRLLGGRALPFAATEYNAMVSLGGPRDADLASPAGALYVADLLRMMGARADMLMANYWSLIGNWFFGSMDDDGRPRPVFEVLRMFRSLLNGQVVATEVVSGRRFSVPIVGLARAGSSLPAVTALATQSGNVTRVVLLNKAPNAVANASVSLNGRSVSKWRVRRWSARAAFDSAADPAAVTVSTSTMTVNGAVTELALAPTSLTLLESL